VAEEDKMNNSMTPELVRAYQEELLREAAQGRVDIATKVPTPGLWAHVLVRAGTVLISIGSMLVERYRPVLVGGSCVCPDATRKALG
jgi:hypothetical protein